MSELEKEFVPYQESLKLKELGFDEPCFGYYYTLNGKDWKFAEKSEYYRLDDEINIGGKFSLLAPLYSQAFRWFREKYNMKPCFDWHPTEKYRYCIYYSVNTYFQICDFETHEEAELECLKKLIEICRELK
jgi:hypothetical protein